VLSPHWTPRLQDGAEPRLQPPFAPSARLLPNLSDWNLGDVLLYAPDSYAFRQRLISTGQRFHFPSEHACWTHCALYVGGGYVVDSVGASGVDKRSIETLTQDGHIRVRRLKSIRGVDQQDLANAANGWIGAGYATFKAILAGLTPYFPQLGQFV
jgi:hypothetical protein